MTNASEKLNRVIGRLGFSAITLNGVIGAGIFALPAIAAERVGAFSPWLFVICAVLILTIVLAFAWAASFVSDTGGPIVYATEAFGPFVGFQTGWLLYLSRLAAMAANVVLLVTYAEWIAPALAEGWPRAVALILVTSFLTVINIIGVRSGMFAIYALSILKLLPLSLLVILGIGQVDPGLLVDSSLPPFDSLGETVLIVLYAFVGFESAVIPAGEARNPKRDIPIALIGTVFVITLLYFLIQWVSLSVLPELAGQDRPLAEVAAVLMGSVGAGMLVIGALFSIGGNGSASMLSAPRLTFALAENGHLPAWFGKVHDGWKTPANSIAFYGIAAIALALSGSFILLAVISTLVRLIMYALVIASLPALRRKYTAADNAFNLPGGMLIPGIALLLCVWLGFHASAQSWVGVAVCVAIGTALYVFTTQRASK